MPPNTKRRLPYWLFPSILMVFGLFVVLSRVRRSRRHPDPPQFSVEAFVQTYPKLPEDAVRRLTEVISAKHLSQGQAAALVGELYGQGQALLPDSDLDELAALYATAMRTLDSADLVFAASVVTAAKTSGVVDTAGQARLNGLMAEAFAKLPPRAYNRYLEIQGKALELALTYPESARRAYESK